MTVLLQYAFTGSVYTPTTVAANMNGSAVAKHAALTTLGIQTGLGYDSDPVAQVAPATSATSQANAVTYNSFVAFTAEASDGYLINPTSLTVKIARGGSSTPRGWGLRSSVDDFASDIATADSATVRTTWAGISVDLSGAGYQGKESIGFRLYIYAPATSNTQEIDDIVLNGAVAANGAYPGTTLLRYSVNGDSLDPTTAVTGVGGSTLTKANGAYFLGVSSDGYPTDPNIHFIALTIAQTKAQALSNGTYFTAVLTPTAGYTVNLTSLTFNVAKGGSGTRGWIVRSSADAYAADLGTGDCAQTRPTWEPITIDLTGAAFQGRTSAITFRFYAYSGATNASVEFDDITVNGTASAAAYTLAAATGTFALAGQAATLTCARKVPASVVSFAETGIAALLKAARLIAAANSASTLSGNATGLRATRTLPAAAGSQTLTGVDTGLRAGRLFSASPVSYAETGIATGLRTTRTLGAGAGDCVLTGITAGLRTTRTLGVDVRSYGITGIETGLLRGRMMVANSAAYDVTGLPAGLLRGLRFVVDVSPYTLTGIDVLLGEAEVYILAAAPAGFNVTGNLAGLRADRALGASPGGYALTASTTGLGRGRLLTMASAAYALSATAAGLRTSRTIAAATVAYVIAGRDVALTGTIVDVRLRRLAGTPRAGSRSADCS